MTLSSRLAALWPFDATHGASVADEYLNAFPLDGGTAPSVTGKVRQCLDCEASSSQYRSRSDAAGLRQLKGCCVWITLESKAADMVVLSKGSSVADDDQSIKLWYDQSSDTLTFTVGDDTTSTSVATTGLTIATDTWYFVRCFNDGNRMGIEVNGTLYGTATARTPLSETGTLYIGRDVSGNYWDGKIDELAVFSTAPTRADGMTFYNGGDGISLPEYDAMPGPTGRAGAANRWIPPSFAESTDRMLYIAHGKRKVQRFTGHGSVATAGVPAPATQVTVDTSGSGRILGPFYAYVRNVDSAGRVSSVSPVSDVHQAFGSATGTITGATNSSPIVVTAPSHGLSTGKEVRITGQTGNTAMNGIWFITVLDANTFSLDGSQGNGDWTSSVAPTLVVTESQAGRAAVNAAQTLTFSATPSGGTFTLTLDGQTTGAISATASAGTIQTALESLGSIGSGNVSCSGGALPTTVTVTFQGTLAGTAVSTLTADTTNVLGATVDLTVATLTNGDPGTDEVQVLTLYGTPTGGTFTLTYDGQTTSAIAYNADAATVQAALEALSNVGVGDIVCTGGALPGTAITMTFGGALAATNVDGITATTSSLTGGSISASVAETTPGAPSLSTGLTNYWTFEESSGTRFDSAGSLDLTPSGTVGAVSGVQGNCASFASPFGTLASSSITIYDDDSFTLAGWVYPVAYTATGKEGVFYADSYVGLNSTTSHVSLMTDYGSGVYRLRAVVAVDGFAYTLQGLANLPSTSVWYHVAVTYNADTGVISLYQDGVLQQQTTGITPAHVSRTAYPRFGEGMSSATTTTRYTGRVDEFAKFNRAISVTEVGELYNSGSGVTYPLSSGADEVQTITVSGSPAQGTFLLTYSGQTATINYDDSASEVETALEALSSIGSGNVSCGGGPLPGTAVTVTFQGDLAATNVALMTVNDDLLQYSVSTTAAGSPTRSEQQRISASPAPASGTWTATFGANTTSAMAFNISASSLQTELEGLASIGAGNISVTGGPLATAPFVMTFQGTLANANQSEMTAVSSLLGAVPSMTIAVTATGLSAVNEIQQISVNNVEGGTFTLTLGGQTTSALSFDINRTDLETALEALSTIDNVAVTGGPLTVGSFSVEFLGSQAGTNVALLTAVSSLQNGGWGAGANTVTYSNVEVPTDLRVVKRQLLRTKTFGSAVAYVDIETTDVTSTSFTSSKTDDDLTESVVLIDANGVDTNLSRHGEPPSWKHVMAEYQNRLFSCVDYVESDGILYSDGATVSGIGTDWPSHLSTVNTFGSALSASYVNDTLSSANQTVVLTDYAETEETADRYRMREVPPDGQMVYHSWLTAAENFPESFSVAEPFQVSRDRRAGEMAGAYSFDGVFYVVFENQTYRYAFATNPAQSPDGDGQMEVVVPRGMLNHNCVTFADDIAYLIDRQGCYRFNGTSVESISDTIKPLLTGTASTRINWRNSQWFHCQYFPDSRVVRYFVALDGGPYPRHALCYNIAHQYWWIEEYPVPITSSTNGTVNGKSTIFLGSTKRRIFTLSGNHDLVPATTVSTLRGTVDTVGADWITDASATFNSDLVGSFIRFETTTGNSEVREIVAINSSTRLEVDVPFLRQPAFGDTYQIGGIAWSIQTGIFRYIQMNQRELRKMEIVWQPTVNSSLIRHRILEDMSETALVSRLTSSGTQSAGVSVTDGSEYRDVDTRRQHGHAEREFSTMRQEGTDGVKLVSFQFNGITNGEAHRIHSLAVSGVE